MAQFIPWLSTAQQRKGTFACVAFSFGLNTVLYRVSLYAQGKETPTQMLTKSLKAVGDELGSLNVQENAYQNPELLEWYLWSAFHTLCCSNGGNSLKVIVSWWMLCFNGIQGSTVGKEQISSAWTTSFEGFGPSQQGLDQPKTLVKDTPEEREV